MRRRKVKSVHLVGRDPTCGLLAFKTGKHRSLKDKLRSRTSKQSQKQKRQDSGF